MIGNVQFCLRISYSTRVARRNPTALRVDNDRKNAGVSIRHDHRNLGRDIAQTLETRVVRIEFSPRVRCDLDGRVSHRSFDVEQIGHLGNLHALLGDDSDLIAFAIEHGIELFIGETTGFFHSFEVFFGEEISERGIKRRIELAFPFLALIGVP